MYCTKCGMKIPEGSSQCPRCTQARANWVGKVFHFHFESGRSARSVTEIDHTVTFQSDALVITRQKSVTVFNKKSQPPVTQVVNYHEIRSVRTKTGLAPMEIPIIILLVFMIFATGEFLYTVIYLILAALSIFWAIRSVITIELKNHEVLKIPYSGNHPASEFLEALHGLIG